jgi:hypothetical protein
MYKWTSALLLPHWTNESCIEVSDAHFEPYVLCLSIISNVRTSIPPPFCRLSLTPPAYRLASDGTILARFCSQVDAASKLNLDRLSFYRVIAKSSRESPARFVVSPKASLPAKPSLSDSSSSSCCPDFGRSGSESEKGVTGDSRESSEDQQEVALLCFEIEEDGSASSSSSAGGSSLSKKRTARDPGFPPPTSRLTKTARRGSKNSKGVIDELACDEGNNQAVVKFKEGDDVEAFYLALGPATTAAAGAGKRAGTGSSSSSGSSSGGGCSSSGGSGGGPTGWYPATITCVHADDRTFDVLYEDESFDLRVKASALRAVPKKPKPFALPSAGLGSAFSNDFGFASGISTGTGGVLLRHNKNYNYNNNDSSSSAAAARYEGGLLACERSAHYHNSSTSTTSSNNSSSNSNNSSTSTSDSNSSSRSESSLSLFLGQLGLERHVAKLSRLLLSSLLSSL